VALTIRPAEGTDIAAMAAIRTQEWGTEAYWVDRISGYMNGQSSPQQALPERTVYVAIEEGKLVGLVAGHRTRRLGCDAELEWVNVVPEKRGQGIADKLMAQMGAWFVEQDAGPVCVNVAPENATARKLYARWGAHELNKFWMVWDDARLIGTRD